MSNTSITGLSVRELAATITQQLDADKDGKLSSAEFEGFLSQFLGVLKNDSGHAPVATSPLTALPPSTTNATARETVGTLAGYDSSKLANENHKSAKYEVGRILQYYPNTPEGLKVALPELQKLAPNAQIVGSKGDKVDFGGYVDGKGNVIGVVDVLEAAGLGGRAWQWLPD